MMGPASDGAAVLHRQCMPALRRRPSFGEVPRGRAEIDEGSSCEIVGFAPKEI